jgi:hypothetical protein
MATSIISPEGEKTLDQHIEMLGLAENVRELREQGFTVLHDAQAAELADAVREAIIRVVPAEPDAKAATRFTILDQDPAFADAIALPRLLTLIEVLLGKGFVFSQLSGSRRRPSKGSLNLHADNSWFPAPFPEWEIMATACFVTDEFTLESGATLVIPGTHKLKRHPTPQEQVALSGARPIVAPKGAIALWDGSVWHGNYPRQLPGERVVLHMTYTRIGMHPIENYDHLGEEWFAGKSAELPRLLGRDIFLGRKPDFKQNDRELLMKTYAQVHGDSPMNGTPRVKL